MNSRKDIAINSFRSGLNCAQSVLTAFTAEYGIDYNTALQISCGFGGGMGRLQETCGAVTGAFMVTGIHNCQQNSDNKTRKDESYAMIQKFDKQFKAIHGTTNCRELLNCDLKTVEGRKYAQDNNLYEKICEKCIGDSTMIIEELIIG